MMLTDYSQNKIVDAWWRGQALSAPATRYAALFTASKGVRANSTAYALNDTMVVQVNGKYQLYKCTTAGSTASAQPNTYAGATGEAITDGTAVLTEQSVALDAGSIAEVPTSGTGYARVSVASSLTNWAGTQGAGSTAASSGTSGATSPNNALTFPSPIGQWHPTGGMVVGIMFYDAATGGNPLEYLIMSAPKNVNQGDPAPSAAAGGLVFQIGG